ncbi:MAG: hypothetical protein V1839_03285 [archaeon]
MGLEDIAETREKFEKIAKDVKSNLVKDIWMARPEWGICGLAALQTARALAAGGNPDDSDVLLGLKPEASRSEI